MTILSARISASLIVAPGSCRPRARPEQPQGWGPRFQRPEEGQSVSCSERTGAPASRVAGVALEPARATFLQPSSLPFAAGCGVGRRPPSSGYAGQACCSHVGPVGVGSRAGVSRSQEAAALCTLLVPSCWWLPRGVASSPQQCAVQSPSARGVPGGGAPTRGEDTCRGASQPLQPTATAQAPFAYERPGGPGRANAP